jgi:hypothetical protein
MTMKSSPADLTAFLPIDTGILKTVAPGTNSPTGWDIEIAGPSHPKTIAHQETIARRSLREAQRLEQAQANGRKWKAEERDVADNRREFIEGLVARIVGWSPVSIGGKTYEFSESSAVELLSMPAMGSFVAQIVEYLLDERSFMKPSTPK